MSEIQQNIEIPKFKLIFLGDQGTGKSSILNRFINDKFEENSLDCRYLRITEN
jgi:GTPase SAR1 family protein